MNRGARIGAKLLWMLVLMGVLVLASQSTVDFVYRAF
jgi:hypothetical protein